MMMLHQRIEKLKLYEEFKRHSQQHLNRENIQRIQNIITTYTIPAQITAPPLNITSFDALFSIFNTNTEDISKHTFIYNIYIFTLSVITTQNIHFLSSLWWHTEQWIWRKNQRIRFSCKIYITYIKCADSLSLIFSVFFFIIHNITIHTIEGLKKRINDERCDMMMMMRKYQRGKGKSLELTVTVLW